MQLSSNETSFRAERLYVNKLNIILVQVWLSLKCLQVSRKCFYVLFWIMVWWYWTLMACESRYKFISLFSEAFKLNVRCTWEFNLYRCMGLVLYRRLIQYWYLQGCIWLWCRSWNMNGLRDGPDLYQISFQLQKAVNHCVKIAWLYWRYELNSYRLFNISVI
jgi:hypothetical protein